MRWGDDVGYRELLRLSPVPKFGQEPQKPLEKALPGDRLFMWQYGVPGNFWLPQKHRSREAHLSGKVCGQCGSCPQGFRYLWELDYTMSYWDPLLKELGSLGSEACLGLAVPGPHGGYELWLLTATHILILGHLLPPPPPHLVTSCSTISLIAVGATLPGSCKLVLQTACPMAVTPSFPFFHLPCLN